MLTRVLNFLPLFQLALARAVLAAAAFPPLFKRKVRVRQNELLRPSVVLSLVALLLAVSPRPCSLDVSLPLGALSPLACMHPSCQPPFTNLRLLRLRFTAARSDFISREIGVAGKGSSSRSEEVRCVVSSLHKDSVR